MSHRLPVFRDRFHAFPRYPICRFSDLLSCCAHPTAQLVLARHHRSVILVKSLGLFLSSLVTFLWQWLGISRITYLINVSDITYLSNVTSHHRHCKSTELGAGYCNCRLLKQSQIVFPNYLTRLFGQTCVLGSRWIHSVVQEAHTHRLTQSMWALSDLSSGTGKAGHLQAASLLIELNI